jgi:hypothetical protein
MKGQWVLIRRQEDAVEANSRPRPAYTSWLKKTYA